MDRIFKYDKLSLPSVLVVYTWAGNDCQSTSEQLEDYPKKCQNLSKKDHGKRKVVVFVVLKLFLIA